MNVSLATLLPLLTKLGTYFKMGLDHYTALKASGALADPDVIALFICAKMEDWNPQISGKSVLDPETKLAAARMLGGFIVNLSTDREAS